MGHRVLEDGWTRTATAEAARPSVRKVYKWLSRYRAGAERGLMERAR